MPLEKKMSITTEDVKHIAHLARLGINDEQVKHLTSDLTRILDMVAKMDELDTSQVEPMAHPSDKKQFMRQDAVTALNQRELLMANAPRQEAGLFLVPKVIE